MGYTFEQLNGMTVAQLRDIAKDVEHEAVHGFTTMHKEKLVPALCVALNIEAHVHHHVVGLNKVAVKAEIKSWKRKRDEATAKKDYAELSAIRRHIHDLKGKLRRSMD